MIVVSRKYFGNEIFLKVYSKLIRTAHKRKTIYYKDVAEIMGLPIRGEHMAREVGQILGEISEWEHDEGRPLLSAVVIREDIGIPGEGFFKLARELGKFQGQNEQDFWQNELQDVHNIWS
jgi:hypothetical protein